ncbi:fatty acid desaturase [Sphingomonas sp. BN140010]|uniref:Fatty acid desaturase n=1 Tax=Sphingomonas arvum TaxID=2992113 RepID=A0ABT3JCZ0_9SPHN|nr:fatty acid desaturase [Sphingomonas sp. BN140010]MCW3796906.1 fatty acid desaturase [Sphingomonas sp. BN140010]
MLDKVRAQERAAFREPTIEGTLGQVLARRFKAFKTDKKVATRQLVTTAVPLAALIVTMAIVSYGYYWLTLLLAVPAAGLLIRLFIIQHDCGHGSFFPSRMANDVLGRVLSVLTLTPYASWARGHAAHHASAGNLDRRGRGDVDTWTVSEYLEAGPAKKLLYRLLRNPFFLVGVGAPLNFIVLQRVPRGGTFRDGVSRRSVLTLNVALLVVYGSAIIAFGAFAVLGTYLPVIIVASWIGNWLFFVQHQFEGTHWERDGAWNFHEAALKGSSYFKLPPILQWFSGSIGLHHVHHLSSRVPNYHLQSCLEAAPELDGVSKVITLRESLGCWRLALWDEQRGTLVSFRDLKPFAAEVIT